MRMATWIIQKADRDRTAAYSALERSQTVGIDGDHNVFGDGAVVIKSTPGHTPGHQSFHCS